VGSDIQTPRWIIKPKIDFKLNIKSVLSKSKL
jgi:hypothetical protein